MALEVIGVGFGRTGTSSLKLALEQLGFGPCCHGSDERHFKDGINFWHRVFNEQQIDWDEFFEGYRSTVDSPSCRFFRELAEKYPSAKFILTLRESGAWFDSYRTTVLPLIRYAYGGRYFSFLFGGHLSDRDSIVSAYERHNAEVQRLIPSERLLIYEVERGWEPLCSFLDVPVPDTPFPYSNSRTDFPTTIDRVVERLVESGN
jgi:hypothetical protein